MIAEPVQPVSFAGRDSILMDSLGPVAWAWGLGPGNAELMTITRDWQRNKQMWVRVLERQTGESVAVWNRRIAKQDLPNESALRAWLASQGVTGYAQSLLIMERFGYPDFVSATADQLIERQYADRRHLRPIYHAVVAAASACGEVVIQARKTYVSLVSPRRTFARVQATTKTRVDLGLRLETHRPGGRLQVSKIHESMRLQVSLTTPSEVDRDVQRWLRQAYRGELLIPDGQHRDLRASIWRSCPAGADQRARASSGHQCFSESGGFDEDQTCSAILAVERSPASLRHDRIADDVRDGRMQSTSAQRGSFRANGDRASRRRLHRRWPWPHLHLR